MNKFLTKIWFLIVQPIAAIMLLIFSYDVYVGNIDKGNPTLPHQAYILVPPVLLSQMWKILKFEPKRNS